MSEAAEHAVVSRDEWIAERKKLLAREKELTRLRDQIARAKSACEAIHRYDQRQTDALCAAMAKAGADIIVCHMGLTTGGAIGAATALQLADCPALVDKWSEAALKMRRDVIVLVHGGPVAEPADAEFVLKNTKNCHGFYGASSMERLPVEVALTEQTRKFKQIGRR